MSSPTELPLRAEPAGPPPVAVRAAAACKGAILKELAQAFADGLGRGGFWFEVYVGCGVGLETI
jgi:hypothetical protein